MPKTEERNPNSTHIDTMTFPEMMDLMARENPVAEMSVVTDTGAEVITGSTRMKPGTAQTLVLNMISTAVMVSLGYVYENMMINLKSSNEKLRLRVIGIFREITGETEEKAVEALDRAGWDLRSAIEEYNKSSVKK